MRTMIAAAMRRMSTLAKEGKRNKGYIFWPTEHARKLVVAVLQEEPAKKFGLRTPAMYKNIMDRFPDEKLHYHLLAPVVRASIKSGTILDASHPPHPAHPIRSVHYLKHVVLSKMESREQIEQIRVVRGQEDEAGNRIDTIHCQERRTVETMATDVVDEEEWRWRLVPGAVLTPFRSPTPGVVFGRWAQIARENKLNDEDRDSGQSHPPVRPPKRFPRLPKHHPDRDRRHPSKRNKKQSI
ncbi:hypothetical protein BDZ89DRAFT_63555 [Hymenopellis radicata]|nr:hypothetical protein BDZ89DRAFT_63555 [Hymenopellis radicata]